MSSLIGPHTHSTFMHDDWTNQNNHNRGARVLTLQVPALWTKTQNSSCILEHSVTLTKLYWKMEKNTEQECIPAGCIPPTSMAISKGWAVQGGCVCPGGCVSKGVYTPCPIACWDTHPHSPAQLRADIHPPWTDRHLWKHYLSAITVAGGKKSQGTLSVWESGNHGKKANVLLV